MVKKLRWIKGKVPSVVLIYDVDIPLAKTLRLSSLRIYSKRLTRDGIMSGGTGNSPVSLSTMWMQGPGSGADRQRLMQNTPASMLMHPTR